MLLLFLQMITNCLGLDPSCFSSQFFFFKPLFYSFPWSLFLCTSTIFLTCTWITVTSGFQYLLELQQLCVCVHTFLLTLQGGSAALVRGCEEWPKNVIGRMGTLEPCLNPTKRVCPEGRVLVHSNSSLFAFGHPKLHWLAGKYCQWRLEENSLADDRWIELGTTKNEELKKSGIVHEKKLVFSTEDCGRILTYNCITPL